jgi:hypothetical protein
MRLASSSRIAGAALVLALVACGSAPNDSSGTSNDEIVNVPQSSVKSQTISNCWLYATLGWAESLHVATGEPALDVSESYLSYWNWFDKLVWDGAPGKTAIEETGWFHQGMDLIMRFGVIMEGDFTSARQSAAKSALDAAMREGGALATKEARMDKVLVRRELNKAWQLPETVVQQMNAVFGEGYDRSLDQPTTVIPQGSIVRHANTISAKLVNGNGETRTGTLADAIGLRDWNNGWGKRQGAFAWNEVDYPKEPAQRRAFQIRFQKALHAKQPVVISWFIDFAGMEGSAFRKPPERPGRQGGHVTVLEDYQIDNVPGFGLLAAGVDESRPEALNAALSPDAKIQFLRTKNSWGQMNGPVPEFNGYLDLYMPYLDGPATKCDDPPAGTTGERTCVNDHVPLWRAALPPGF